MASSEGRIGSRAPAFPFRYSLFAIRYSRNRNYSLIVRTTDEVGRSLTVGSLISFATSFVILRERPHRILRLQVDNLVAVRLELPEQLGERIGGRLLDVMHQHDAHFVITDLITCPDRRMVKSKESKSVEKMPILRWPR
jgi:hypothetical protein